MKLVSIIRALGGGLALSALTAMAAVPATAAEPGKTLKTVQKRGELLCTGHNGTYLGFAEVDDAVEGGGEFFIPDRTLGNLV